MPFSLKSMSSRGFKYSADDINLHEIDGIQGDHAENAMGRSGMFGRKSDEDDLRKSMVSRSDSSSDDSWTGPYKGAPAPPPKSNGWMPSMNPGRYFHELQAAYITKPKQKPTPPLLPQEQPKPTTIFGYTLGFKKWGAEDKLPVRPTGPSFGRQNGPSGRDSSASSY